MKAEELIGKLAVRKSGFGTPRPVTILEAVGDFVRVRQANGLFGGFPNDDNWQEYIPEPIADDSDK